MRKIVIITHGDFGKSLLDVAKNFFGANEMFSSLGFDENMELTILEQQIIDLVEEENQTQLLCLVDIKGGTPYNISKRVSLSNGNVDVITGVNLGMILQLIINPESGKEEVINAALESIGG